MKNTKSIDSDYLSEQGQKIQTLPPDEASTLLLEASTIILFAGFPEIAYQGFLKLIQGELKVSEASALVTDIKKIIPALCYFMNIPCPGIFSEGEMKLGKLKKYINRELREYEYLLGLNPWTLLARRWLKVFEDVFDAWKLDDRIGDVEQEKLVLGILTYIRLEDTSNADKLIQKWWQSLEEWQSLGGLMRGLSVVACLPDLMRRISEGVLQNKINISENEAQEFLESVNRRNYIPIIRFTPTVADWNDFLEKWNQEIFDNLDEEHQDNYEEWGYSKILNSKYCLRIGAKEEEVYRLEKRLGSQLPLSYRNFLLASNGLTILNEDCELYGTDEIKWFIEENRNWAEVWDKADCDVEDERYFQYGEHQDWGWIRGRYMKTALQISSTEDGFVYLLNPQIIDDRNEWEAWDFGDNISGADRYRSFWDMIQEVYKRSFGS